jgi:hypothetical protein
MTVLDFRGDLFFCSNLTAKYAKKKNAEDAKKKLRLKIDQMENH